MGRRMEGVRMGAQREMLQSEKGAAFEAITETGLC